MADPSTTPQRPSDVLRAVCRKIPCLSIRPVKPLAIGLGPALVDRVVELTGCERHVAGWAVAMHTRDVSYLNALREGAGRVDLHGNVVGVVTAEEAAGAAARLAELHRKAAARLASRPKPKPTPATATPSAASPGQRISPRTGRPFLSISTGRATA